MNIITVYKPKSFLIKKTKYENILSLEKEFVEDSNTINIINDFIREVEESEHIIYIIGADSLTERLLQLFPLESFSLESLPTKIIFVVDRDYKSNSLLDRLNLSLLIRNDEDFNFFHENKELFQSVSIDQKYSREIEFQQFRLNFLDSQSMVLLEEKL